MRLLIIRHADPDYKIDSLTETGWKEAALLADRISTLDVKDFYVSPLGRARDTASLTLKKMGREAQVCPWLREFAAKIHKPGEEQESHVVWDWLPGTWTQEEDYFDKERWLLPAPMAKGNVKEEYHWVITSFDQLLAEHGYVREGYNYQAVRANEDTLVFFCHFGVECVLLSHLLHISPLVLWQGLCAAPSSVTTLITEERREGTAAFRMSAFADVSHLYKGGREPSFAARFCEIFSRMDQRHD